MLRNLGAVVQCLFDRGELFRMMPCRARRRHQPERQFALDGPYGHPNRPVIAAVVLAHYGRTAWIDFFRAK